MATLDQLSFDGIRSYPPGNLQEIDLHNKSLCIVQGMNGCGKTTIVECLKFVVTGSLPPNSNNGQSFVQDPKVAGMSQVDGRINVKFRTSDGRKVLVMRKVRVKQAKSKLSFSQLDTLVKTRVKGENAEMSSKCANTDVLVPEMLKVSKPILENVIFCHQEDSLWPMQESSVLKKKFDDIFESTRYNKALEEVKKQKKKLTDKGKQHESNARVLEVHKKTFQKLHIDQEQLLEQYEEVKARRKELKKNITHGADRILALEATRDASRQEQAELAEMRAEMVKLNNEFKSGKIEILTEYRRDKVGMFFDDDEPSKALPEVRELVGKAGDRRAQNEADAGKLRTMKVDMERELNELVKREQTLERTKIELQTKLSLEAKNQGQVARDLQQWFSETTNEAVIYEQDKWTVHQKELTEVLRTMPSATAGFSQQQQDNSGQRMRAIDAALRTLTERMRAAEEDLGEKKARMESAREQTYSKASTVTSEIMMKKKEQLQLQQNEKDLIDQVKKMDNDLRAMQMPSKQANVAAELAGDLIKAKQRLKDQEKKIDDEKEKGGDSSANALNDKLRDIQTELRKSRNELADLQREHDKAVQFRTLGGSLHDWVHNTFNPKASAAEIDLDPGQFAQRTGYTADIGNSGLPPLHVLFQDLDTDDGFSALSMALDARKSALSVVLEFAREKSKVVTEEVSRRKYELEDKQQALMRKTASRESAQERVDNLTAKQTELERPLVPASAMALFKQRGETRSPATADAIQEHLANKMETAREESEGTLEEAKVFEQFLAHMRTSGRCPCCYRPVSDEYPQEGGTANVLAAIFPPMMRDQWLDIVGSHAALLQDVHYEMELNKNFKGTIVSFEKGRKLKGPDLLVAVLAARVSSLSSKEGQDAKRREVESAQAAVDEFAMIKNTFYELPNCKEKLDAAAAELSANSAAVAGLDREVEECKEAQEKAIDTQSLCNAALDALSGLLERVEDGLRARDEVKATSFSLADQSEKSMDRLAWAVADAGDTADSKTPLEAMRGRIEELSKQDLEVQAAVSQQQEKEKNLQEQLNAARNTVHNLRDEHQKNADSAVKLEQLITRKAEMNATLSASKTRKAEISNELRQLEKTSQKLKSEETKAAVEADRTIGKLTRTVERARKVHAVVESGMRSSAAVAAGSGLAANLNELLRAAIEEQNVQYQLRCSKEAAVESLQMKVRAAENAVDNSESTTRMYEKVERVLSKFEFLNEVTQTVTTIKQAIKSKSGSIKSVVAEIDALTEANHEAEKQLAHLGGSSEQLAQQLRDVQNSLRARELDNIVKRHRVANVAAQTTLMAAGDLDRYYAALDTALMQFHQQKIEEINRNVNQLWLTMYKGGDIDSIQLRSEKTTTGRSRSFNYRVVMTKGNTQLDMRGRCSAGQKVLAAIVIRMALAQSFSASISFLALDEPTTNLDQKNKIGLAHALGTALIQFPKMQLIVITHDSDFVDVMRDQTDASGRTVYYHVSRSISPVTNKWVSKISLEEDEDENY